MPKENKQAKSYLLCETPFALEELGVKPETARALAERFACLRLTKKTRTAIENAASYKSEASHGPEDERILVKMLTDVIDARVAKAEAERLLGEFDSLLGVLDAIDRLDRRVGLTSGVRMRIELLAAVHLSECRALRVLTRPHVERLAEALPCVEDITYAFVLDGEYALVAIKTFATDEILPETAADEIAQSDARFVIFLRKEQFLSDTYYNLGGRARKLGSELSERGVKLLDFLIYMPQGTATLKPDAGNPPEFVFEPVPVEIEF